MISVHPPGDPNRTLVIGKSQGYLGLAVNFRVYDDGTPALITAWQPTPKELEALNAGASVEIELLTPQHPPIKVGVTDPPPVD